MKNTKPYFRPMLLKNSWNFAVYPLLLMILISLGSCGLFTPEKRLKRLVKNHPHLLTQKTIIALDTIRDTIEHVVKGQALSISTSLGDLSKPIILNRGFLHLSASLNAQKDSVFIFAKCDTVFIRIPYEKIVEIPVEVETVVVNGRGFGFIGYCLLFSMLFCVSCIVYAWIHQDREPDKPPE